MESKVESRRSKTAKPLASLSLDLDNKWSYLKTRGAPAWQSYPTYLPLVVPRVLEFLKQRGLTISMFIVGQDAARDENREALASIAEAGHEIGNHSFHHEPWLHLYTEAQLEDEMTRAEENIERVTGKRPIGFRGPGFTVSPTTLRVLARHGYRYDASTLPTYLGPLARLYYFLSSSLDKKEKEQRKLLFGKISDGFQPIKPYRWDLDGEGQGLLEIPVTTMPLFKVPIHVSYVLYLSQISPALARLYFRSAMRLCRLTGTEPSILLHPLDFLGKDDDSDLTFFPAMGMMSGTKLEAVSRALEAMAREFEIVNMQTHAQAIAERPRLARRDPASLGG
jgi:peptidoglycan-N-acetylglucosamine deacetylase